MSYQGLESQANGKTASTSRTTQKDNSTHQTGSLSMVGADQEAHAKTHALLAAILEKMDNNAEARAVQAAAGSTQDKLTRLLSGKASGLLGLISNFGGAWAFVLPLLVALLNLLPFLPRLASSTLSTLLPFGVLTAAVLVICPAARKLIPRKSTRGKFLLGVMVCYSAAMLLYMFWMSLGLLRQNNLISGFLLALTWVAIYSILRGLRVEIREMRELIRGHLQQEEGELQPI